MIALGFFAPPPPSPPPPSPSAAASAVAQCVRTLERMTDEKEAGLVRAACGPLFRNAEFRRGWDATVGSAPPEILASLLAQAALESYCIAWPAPRPAACTGKVVPKTASARWRALFDKIIDTDVAAADRPALRAAFEKRWALLFGA
jgi:hypothetical protein